MILEISTLNTHLRTCSEGTFCTIDNLHALGLKNRDVELGKLLGGLGPEIFLIVPFCLVRIEPCT